MRNRGQRIAWLSIVVLFMNVIAPASEVNSKVSEGSHFRIRYESKVSPLPLNRIHSWLLQVETLDGTPVDDAIIVISGGMPAHKHGLPTQPMVTALGKGEYLLEGVKFTMTGLWEIEFLIQNSGVSESLTFNIHF